MQHFSARARTMSPNSAASLSWQWLGCLLLCGMLLTVPFCTTANGQSKTSKKTTKAADAEEAGGGLEELTFSAVSGPEGDGGPTSEVDETPEGQARLGEVMGRAREIFRERDGVEKVRRPIAGPRDVLVGECFQLSQAMLLAQQTIIQANNEIRNCQRLLKVSDNTAALNNQIQAAQGRIGGAQTVLNVNQAEIAKRQPTIQALNLQIQPLDERLKKLWEELNNARKQWLELRQPQKKYAYGRFENLKRVLDDWLLVDGLWPEAFCWAALCAYELGSYETAWEFVDKAGEIRTTLNFPKAWAQGEALRGLIALKIPARRGKSAGHLQSAQLYANKFKKVDWQTYFLVGRASFENDKMASKAKANFEKALKINPDLPCVKYWYGRLQTCSTVASVRDVAAGLDKLEGLWQRSTKESWRLSHALVLGYDAANRTADADAAWESTLELAPKAEHKTLIAMRDEAKEKLELMADGDANARKSKPSTKK